jgi:uncharacterized ion transporter superfamily protein YfcC
MQAEAGSKAGAQIGAKAFIQSLLILLALMLLAGILTRVVPAGTYARMLQDGRQVIDPASFQAVPRPVYPVWRWLTAPFEVVAGPDGVTILTILVFLVMIGASFAVLDRSGILRAVIGRIVIAFGARKYLLLLVVSFFFMLVGAFFGIFEEVVPLVPLMLALAYFLGWDSLVGLGMSILATNMGFSAAVTNPFTIGVAQKIAGLPLFSGAWLRVLIFIAVYIVFALFLVGYAHKIDRHPEASPVYAEERAARGRHTPLEIGSLAAENPALGRASAWFAVFLVLILLALVAGPVFPAISAYSLPLVGVLFLFGGMGAGLLSGTHWQDVLTAAGQGILGVAPGIPLILMAASIKYIVAAGGIMDTILHAAAGWFTTASPVAAVFIVYLLALGIEFFVASGSAKAFLLMPILLPLADLVGVTRQAAVTAYCFGDGFSNMAYPTNPVLLICLGLTVVSYPKWLRWSLKLWLWMGLLTMAFLAIAVLIRFGPF